MTTEETTKTGSDLFRNYLDRYKDEAKSTSQDGYYHVDVVAEAYNQGFSDGAKSGRKEFVNNVVKQRVEEFTQKAQQVYILTQHVIVALKKEGYSVNSFYINIVHKNPQVLIAVNNQLLLEDDFITLVYQKIFEMKKIFNDLFKVTLDMGVIESEGLDIQAVTADGYEYSEELTNE